MFLESGQRIQSFYCVRIFCRVSEQSQAKIENSGILEGKDEHLGKTAQDKEENFSTKNCSHDLQNRKDECQKNTVGECTSIIVKGETQV